MNTASPITDPAFSLESIKLAGLVTCKIPPVSQSPSKRILEDPLIVAVTADSSIPIFPPSVVRSSTAGIVSREHDNTSPAIMTSSVIVGKDAAGLSPLASIQFNKLLHSLSTFPVNVFPTPFKETGNTPKLGGEV